MTTLRRLWLIGVAAVLLSGCESMNYYSQAVAGQWSLWWQRQPIEQLISDVRTEPELKQRLQQVQAIREFASEQLALPENNSYRYYSDLERAYVVWNVFAAEEFSAQAKRWCFPVAGCVAYRGYFSQREAQQYASLLANEGYDTFVGGVAAYSTLGWFDDPVLNTFLYRDEARLAGLIFHELAHQQVYIPGDTHFNESFARAVEIAGVERWLQGRNPALLNDYLQQQRIHADFVSTLLLVREQLAALYQLALAPAQMRVQKQQRIDHFVANEYQRFKTRWGGISTYDQWVNDGLNNAKLVTIASYHQWLPAFQQLLAEESNDLERFYQRVESLSKAAPERREQQLQALSANKEHIKSKARYR